MLAGEDANHNKPKDSDMVTTTTNADVNGLCTTDATQSVHDAAQANLVTGVLLLCKEALVTAIQDHRLNRGHLRLLAAIAGFINATSAKAWPSRAKLADVLGMSVGNVSNILSELKGFGYLIAGREAIPEANNRRLTVYTFGNVDHDTIRREIEAFVRKVRDERKPVDLTPQGEPRVHPIGGTSPHRVNNSPQSSPPRVSESSPPRVIRNSYKEQERERAPQQPHFARHDRPPRLSENGDFVISDRHNIFVPADIVHKWRMRFSAIADLEAQMEKLSAYILKGGIQHPGWNCPEGWMAGCLATDNQKAKGQAPRQPMKTFRR